MGAAIQKLYNDKDASAFPAAIEDAINSNN
jgi:hypothetical protein